MGALWSRHDSHSAPRRPSWTEATFHNSFDAETGLSADRPGFITRHDIMRLIPEEIKRQIVHAGETAQIAGFRELFLHLNNQPRAQKLRGLVIAYFRDSPVLRGHLSG
jgi:hypothetical protein